MSPKSFAILFAITLITAIAAGWVVITGDTGGTARGEGVLMFPDLAQQVNDVRQIKVVRGGQVSTLTASERDGKLTWSLKELYGYRVPIEIVRAVAAGMAQLRALEPKTARPANYKRINVDNPAMKGSKASLVQLFDAKGNKMAELIVGLDRASVVDVGEIYVRRPGEARAWLAHGKVPVPEKYEGWVNQTIVEVDLPRVRESVLRVPGQKPLRIYKRTPDDRDFFIDGMPAGYQVKDVFAVEDIARAIQTLTFVEVKPEKEIGFDPDAPPRVRHVTFDGLVVSVWLKEVGNKKWIKIRASLNPEPAKGDKVDKAKIEKEVAKINGVTGGWAYTVSPFETKNMYKTMAELIEPKPGAKGGADKKPAAKAKGASATQ